MVGAVFNRLRLAGMMAMLGAMLVVGTVLVGTTTGPPVSGTKILTDESDLKPSTTLALSEPTTDSSGRRSKSRRSPDLSAG